MLTAAVNDDKNSDQLPRASATQTRQTGTFPWIELFIAQPDLSSAANKPGRAAAILDDSNLLLFQVEFLCVFSLHCNNKLNID